MSTFQEALQGTEHTGDPKGLDQTKEHQCMIHVSFLDLATLVQNKIYILVIGDYMVFENKLAAQVAIELSADHNQGELRNYSGKLN